MHQHILGVRDVDGLARRNDPAANRAHHLEKTNPTALEWRPPTQSAAVPGGDAWLVKRGVGGDAAAVALRDALGELSDQLRVIRVQKSVLDPEG